ncbi:MAG TPA: hypothetical protein VKE22_29685, partial [Haliangiales bacterium]|nr:hypothetical protein [Haliangiales bacterium]
MGNCLVLLEYSESHLKGSALSALNAAAQLAGKHGGKVVALLVGKGAGAAADAAKAHAPRTVVVDDARLEHYMAETYAPIVARVAKDEGASAVLAIADNLGKDLMPRVAALLDAGMASDVSAILDKDTFRRPILAGNAIATVKVGSPVVVITARQTEFPPAAAGGDAGEVATATAGDVNALGATVVSVQATKSERPELTDAKIVVSGGRGMRSAENF